MTLGELRDGLRVLVEGATAHEDLVDIIGAIEGERARAWAKLNTTSTAAPRSEGDRMLSMPEVAERLGITEHQAREMGRRHELPITTIGDRFVRVRAGALEEWIRQREGATLARSGGR